MSMYTNPPRPACAHAYSSVKFDGGTMAVVCERCQTVLTHLRKMPVSEELMKIELLHMRDPDSECSNQLYIDGKEIMSFVEESIDPGAGWTAAEWEERAKETSEITSYSPEFKKQVLLGLGESNDSPYITGGDDE